MAAAQREAPNRRSKGKTSTLASAPHTYGGIWLHEVECGFSRIHQRSTNVHSGVDTDICNAVPALTCDGKAAQASSKNKLCDVKPFARRMRAATMVAAINRYGPTRCQRAVNEVRTPPIYRGSIGVMMPHAF